MQPWVANFDSSRPIGLKLPVWITLKNVRDELLSSAQELAGGIGVVLGRHRNNTFSPDQKFCVAVQAGQPFTVEISTVNPVTSETMTVQVDYNNLPIRCRLCLSTSHLIKDCERALGQKRTHHHQSHSYQHITNQSQMLDQNKVEARSKEQATNTARVRDLEGRSAPTGRAGEGRQGVPRAAEVTHETTHQYAQPGTGPHQHNRNQAAGEDQSNRNTEVGGSGTPNKGTTAIPKEDTQQLKARSKEGGSGSINKQTDEEGRKASSPNAHWRKKTVLDCDGWLSRETERGYESSPNASEFSNVNELNAAKNLWRERRREQTGEEGRNVRTTREQRRGRRDRSPTPEDVVMLDLETEPASGKGGQREDDSNAEELGDLFEERRVRRRGKELMMTHRGDHDERQGQRDGERAVGGSGGPDDDEEVESARQSTVSPSGIRTTAANIIAHLRTGKGQATEEEAEGGPEEDVGVINQRKVILGACSEEDYDHTTPRSLQGTYPPRPIPNLNIRSYLPPFPQFGVGEGSDNLSLSLDLEVGSEGGGMCRRKEHVPAHLAPMVRAWLKEQRESNGFLPNSPLRPRPPRKYDGTVGGTSRPRGIRFSPYHSVERLIAPPSSNIGHDIPPNHTHENSGT